MERPLGSMLLLQALQGAVIERGVAEDLVKLMAPVMPWSEQRNLRVMVSEMGKLRRPRSMGAGLGKLTAEEQQRLGWRLLGVDRVLLETGFLDWGLTGDMG